LTPVEVCRSIYGLHLLSPRVIAPDFAGTGVRSYGRDDRAVDADAHVRRFTFGEEHDATGHEALTLFDGKVTARIKVNSSC
jgi:hypothetical protein